MNTWIHVYMCRFCSPVWIFSPALSRNHREARLGAGVGSPCCLSHQKQLIWWEPQQRCPGGEQQGRELGKQEGNCRKTPLRAKSQSLSCMQQLGYFHTSLWSAALLTQVLMLDWFMLIAEVGKRYRYVYSITGFELSCICHIFNDKTQDF